MTDQIEISVETTYLSSESNPDDNKYYFLYTVLIKNNSDKKAKLSQDTGSSETITERFKMLKVKV